MSSSQRANETEMQARMGINKMETLRHCVFHGPPTWLPTAGQNKSHNPFPNLVFTAGSPEGHSHLSTKRYSSESVLKATNIS